MTGPAELPEPTISNAACTSPLGSPLNLSSQQGHSQDGGSPRLGRRASNPSVLLQKCGSAAEARAVDKLEDTVELDSVLPPQERLRFYRCLDSDLVPPLAGPVQKSAAIKIMSTLLILLENALEKGIGKAGDPKYLQIKLSNPAIQSRLGLNEKQVKNQESAPALDWLHLCGWRHHVQDFQEYLIFPAEPSPLKLAVCHTGAEMLRTRLDREKEVAGQSAVRQRLADEDEAQRKGRALQQIKEDRSIRKERDEQAKSRRSTKAAGPLASPTDS